jgi:hypothetical protein
MHGYNRYDVHVDLLKQKEFSFLHQNNCKNPLLVEDEWVKYSNIQIFKYSNIQILVYSALITF